MLRHGLALDTYDNMLAIAFEDPNLKMVLSHSHPIHLMAKMFFHDKL